jgi:hypothetical protein
VAGWDEIRLQQQKFTSLLSGDREKKYCGGKGRLLSKIFP